jgi:glycosyltransferase involved in cell wall biosynthesis
VCTSMKGLVSVIMPAYNAEKYIGEAIESVLKQTYPYFELIVVDDGSKDRTAEIVESFKDKRVNLMEREVNGGASAARNTAIDVSKGKWLAMIDADDQWLPERLEKLLALLSEDEEQYFVGDDSIKCFDTPNGLKPWISMLKMDYNIIQDGKILELSFFEYAKLGFPAIHPIVPSKSLKIHDLAYNPAILKAADFDFHCNLFRIGLKLKLYKKAYYLYRLTPDSITSKVYDSSDQAISVMLKDNKFNDEYIPILKTRFKRVKIENKYIKLTYTLKKKEFYKAFLLFLNNPTLLLKLIIRLPRSLRYRITAKLYGANIK